MRAFQVAIVSVAVLMGAECRAQVRPEPDSPEFKLRENKYRLAHPVIMRAKADSKAAAEARIAKVNEYFAERKKAVRPFAKKVLSEGQGHAAGDASMGIFSAISSMFGYKPTVANSLKPFIENTFRKDVLDPDDLRKVIDAAVAGYTADVLRIERKLAVDIRIDLPDNAYGIGLAWYLKPNDSFGIDNGEIVGRVVDAVVSDLAASAVKYTASFVAGNIAADMLSNKEDGIAKKVVVGTLAGAAADEAINRAALAAGYQPENDMVADIEKSLNEMQERIIDGGSLVKQHYDDLLAFLDRQHNNKVLAACRQAADTIRTRGNIGLTHRLMTVHEIRSKARIRSLRGAIMLDPTADPWTTDDAPDLGEVAIIEWANKAHSYYRNR